MKRLLAAALIVAGAGVSAGSSVRAASPDSGRTAWLHVRVEEPGKGSRVHVNLPLPVVEIALQAAPEKIESDGHFHFGRRGHGDMEVADLRRAWKELKAAGDTDIVNVEDEDGTATVSRRGDTVQVRVQHHGEREQVAVDLPVAVVDALFANGDGDELNVRGALNELRKMRGSIVSVHDHDSRVRVWIDEDSSSQGDR
jgi:hypothetical protein